MRLTSAIIAAAAAAMLGAPAQAAGHFVNGSFEHGFEGWVADEDQVHLPGVANHRDEFGAVDHDPYDPIDGYYMAAMQANVTDTAVLLSQTFTTLTGGHFSGWAAFLGEDYLPWNDSGFVRIYQLGSETELSAQDLSPNPTELFFADIAGVGDWSQTEWTHFSLRLAAGTYRVEAGVIDRNDDREPSLLILDNFQMVPEPATWVLMIGGFFGLGAALRRRRGATAVG